MPDSGFVLYVSTPSRLTGRYFDTLGDAIAHGTMIVHYNARGDDEACLHTAITDLAVGRHAWTDDGFLMVSIERE